MTARASRKAGLTCQRAFQRMAGQCLTSIRQHRAAASRGDPEPIHQIRIALTKLQAARKFFADMTRDAEWPKLKAEIQWLNSALGAARDNDVTTGYAKAQRGRSVTIKERNWLTTEAENSHRRLAVVLRSKRCDHIIAGLEHWIDNGQWLTTDAAPAKRRRNQLLADHAPARLQRWKRRLVRNNATDIANGRRRHRLRIATKRYRYMREALTAMGIPEGRTGLRDRRAAQAAQRALGDLRDLQRFRKLRLWSFPGNHYRLQKRRLLRKATRAFHRLG